MGELAEAAVRIRTAVRSGDVGRSLVAMEVMSISRRWDTLKSEADDVSFAHWLKYEVSSGYNHGWWSRLAKAVQALGKPVASKMSSQALVYLSRTVPEAYKAKVQEAALNLARKRPTPVSYSQLMYIVKDIVPSKKREARGCNNCDALRAQVRGLGEVPVA